MREREKEGGILRVERPEAFIQHRRRRRRK
jgi:hypothetical protein